MSKQSANDNRNKPCQTHSSIPWIDDRYAAHFKLGDIASSHRHAVDKRRGGDQSVMQRAWVRHMESGAALGDSSIDDRIRPANAGSA